MALTGEQLGELHCSGMPWGRLCLLAGGEVQLRERLAIESQRERLDLGYRLTERADRLVVLGQYIEGQTEAFVCELRALCPSAQYRPVAKCWRVDLRDRTELLRLLYRWGCLDLPEVPEPSDKVARTLVKREVYRRMAEAAKARRVEVVEAIELSVFEVDGQAERERGGELPYTERVQAVERLAWELL